MYTAKQKAMRRCKKLRKDGDRCKAYAKVGGDFCPLHASFDPKAPRPKKHERDAARVRREKRMGKQRRAVCNCPAFDYPHRLSSGGCRYPDDPLPPSIDDYVRTRADVRTPGESSMESSPGFEQNTKLHAGRSSRRWKEVIDYDEQSEDTSAGRIEWDDAELDSEHPPLDREEREAWSRARLKRLIERETEKEASDFTFHY
jgi:hypothetical protein